MQDRQSDKNHDSVITNEKLVHSGITGTWTTLFRMLVGCKREEVTLQ